MKIISIRKQNENKIHLVFDTGEIIILTYEVFLKNGLKEGDDLDDDSVRELQDESEKNKIKSHAFLYLHRRSHSEAELKQKLLKKGYRGNLVSEVLDYLKSSSYLNDNDFAVTYAEEKSGRYKWGRELIAAGLFKKGISREIVESVLRDISPGDQSAAAYTLLEKKYKFRTAKELIEKRQKMYAFLISKGYNFELSKNAVDEYLTARNVEIV